MEPTLEDRLTILFGRKETYLYQGSELSSWSMPNRMFIVHRCTENHWQILAYTKELPIYATLSSNRSRLDSFITTHRHLLAASMTENDISPQLRKAMSDLELVETGSVSECARTLRGIAWAMIHTDIEPAEKRFSFRSSMIDLPNNMSQEEEDDLAIADQCEEVD